MFTGIDGTPNGSLFAQAAIQEESALTQAERGELEGLIENSLQHIKNSESELCERYRQLKRAPAEDREGFLNSLWELNRRASTLERLIGCLDTN